METDASLWIGLIKYLSAQPKIQSPEQELWLAKATPKDRIGHYDPSPKFKLAEMDKLFSGGGWEERLRKHFAFGSAYRDFGLLPCVYCCFHRKLKLTELAFDACLEAWAKQAWGNKDVENSLPASNSSPRNLYPVPISRRCFGPERRRKGGTVKTL